MQKLVVDLDDRSYPIIIGDDLLSHFKLDDYLKGKQALIITNETIAPLYLEKSRQLFDFEPDTLILPDGEQFKTLETLNRIFSHLLENKHNRTTTLVALGGGVVGDITGFAAACYQRGVGFIQLPTTLLAQVDSSVGGKTAVNHPLGKNMIGAFYQPSLVLADTSALTTLPDREFKAGLAEVIKYGLIIDADFFDWLEKNIEQVIRRDNQALAFIIERSCRSKARIVSMDEKESGIRAILNLGHTFGHAIETFTGYKSWLHGEAVATGMVMAADLSKRSGWLSAQEFNRIKSLIEIVGLPVSCPDGMGSKDFLSLMSVDKKVVDGTLKLVLLNRIGDAKVCSNFDALLLEQTLDLSRFNQPTS